MQCRHLLRLKYFNFVAHFAWCWITPTVRSYQKRGKYCVLKNIRGGAHASSFSTMAEIIAIASLYLLWKYQRRRRTQRHCLWVLYIFSFWPWYESSKTAIMTFSSMLQFSLDFREGVFARVESGEMCVTWVLHLSPYLHDFVCNRAAASFMVWI